MPPRSPRRNPNTTGAEPMMPTGIPVDVSGGPTVDPTRNVLDLVSAAVRRLDDLATARDELTEAKIRRLDDLAESREALNRSEAVRLEALQSSEARHVHEMAMVRTGYESELRQKETERLDAIRAVDVQAVQRAAEVAEIRASTLAGQVAAAAEANRASVTATAVALETKLATALEPLTAAIGELRRTQFEQQGQKIERAEQRTVQVDTRSGNQWVIGVLVAGVFSMISLAIGAAALFHSFTK